MQAAEVILDSQGGRMEVWPHGRPANGAHYRFEWFLAPHTTGPPEHFHPHQEEKLQVISGRLRVRLDGQEVALGPGDRLVIAPGTRHTCGNSGPAETRVRGEFIPGLDIHRFFQTYFAIERSHRGFRRLLAWALLCAQEPEHIGFGPRIHLPLRLTAGLARGVGYRPTP
jgi:quercetin dioxygenase-like cupin family protein